MCRVEDAGVMSSTSSSNSTTSSTHYSSASSSSSSSSSTMSRTTSTTTGTTLCYSESNTICNNTSSSSTNIQQHSRNADDEQEQQQQQIRPLLLEAHQHSMASCKLPLQHDLSSQSSHSFNTHCLLFEKEEQDNMMKDNDDVNPCSTITPASQMLLLQEQNSLLHDYYGDDHNNTSILLSRSRADEEELDALLQRNCSREVSSDSKESTTLEGRSALMSDNGQHQHQHPHQQQRIVLFGVDISHCHERVQFFICAGGVFVFTIAYGYLQELISVHLFSRQYTIFLSTCQFAGYAFWSFVLMNLDKISLRGYPDTICNSVSQDDWSASEKKEPKLWSFYDVWRERYMTSSSIACASGSVMCCPMLSGVRRNQNENENYEKYEHVHDKEKGLASANSPLAIVSKDKPSWIIYVMLSIVRAIDVGMTNGAMRFINYPMKTLVKSSRVAFTMMCGIMIGKKRYSRHEYLMVSMLVIGLFIFIHADMSTKDTVFHPIGLSMLAISLLCDGTFANYSEQIMTKHNITQDEFQFYIYSISFLAMLPVVILNQDFHTAFSYYFLRDGSISDIQKNISRSLVQETNMDKDSSISSAIPTEVYFWNAGRKALVMIFFTLTGLCGSSCNGAITKKFGALSMSITSTSRKACTLFVSFVSFSSNKCTPEHLAGMAIFISALMLKSPSARSSRPNHYRNN